MSSTAWLGVEIPLPDEVGGLPLHPLAVHAPVVLVPLVALGLILLAVHPPSTRRYWHALVVLSLVAVGAAVVAESSGQALRRELGLGSAQHFDLGPFVFWAALAMVVALVALAVVDTRNQPRPVAGKVVAVIAAMLAAVSIVITVLTGHTGAELVWG